MKKIATTFVSVITTTCLFSQQSGYNGIPIRHDTAIQWSAACNKVINLASATNNLHLKKWYLDKIRKGDVVAYKMNPGSASFSSYRLSMPGLETQEWLKGLGIELPSYKNPKEWYFYDKTIPKDNYERYKYRVGALHFSEDSCCGCDEADAFLAKQVLDYKNGKFSIYNVFISPLCARQTPTTPIEWYPLCNVAYNDNAERKFPGPGKEVVLLNTDEVDYEFSRENPSLSDSVLTPRRTEIGSLIYDDILKGKIKPVDIENGRPIPVKSFLTWNMPADTMAVYDINDPSKITEFRVVQSERSTNEFSRLRIKQDLYFDFKNEILYSVIRSIIIMLPVRSADGTIRGYMQFCRIL